MSLKTLRHAAGLLASLILAGAIAACGGGSSSGAHGGTSSVNNGGPNSSTCTAGLETVNGVQTRKFCGPAKATVKVSGQSYDLSGGECSQTSGIFALNIGQVVIGTSDAGKALKKQLTYLGAETNATKDGTYDNSIFSGYTSGVDFTSLGTLTLTNNLQAGTFTGTAILSKAVVTGSFSCS